MYITQPTISTHLQITFDTLLLASPPTLAMCFVKKNRQMHIS